MTRKSLLIAAAVAALLAAGSVQGAQAQGYGPMGGYGPGYYGHMGYGSGYGPGWMHRNWRGGSRNGYGPGYRRGQAGGYGDGYGCPGWGGWR